MVTDTTQPNSPNTSQPLDPTVLAMTKAIGSAESGGGSGPLNYKAPNGGAYQFTPETWAVESKKSLGQSIPLDQADVAQQNEVAYNYVKELGDKGYSQPEVASIWNTGLPDAYQNPNYGTNNAYGSTAKYVDKIKQNYNQNLGQVGVQPPTPQTTPNNPTFMDYLGGKLSSAVNWITKNPETATGLGLGGLAAGAATILAPEIALPAEAGVAAGGGGILAGLGGIATGIAKNIGLGAVGAGTENLLSSLMGGNKNQPAGDATTQPPDTTSGILSALTGDNMNLRNKASTTLAGNLVQALGSTPTGSVFTQKPENQQTVGFGAMMGYAPEVKDGRFDFTGSENQRKGDLKQLDQAATQLTEDEQGSVEDWGRKLKQSVASDKTILAEDRDGINSQIDEMVSANTKQHGATPSLSKFHNIRKGYGNSFRELEALERAGKLPTSLKNKLHRHAYHAAREEVTSKTKNKEAYNSLMKVEEKIIKFGEVERRLKGKKVPYNKTFMKDLGKAFGAGAGAFVGEKIGGPVGAVLGFVIEERLQKSVEKRFGSNTFQTKGMKKVMEQLKRKSPEAYHVVKEGMDKIEKQEKMLALPAGAIPMPAGKHGQSLAEAKAENDQRIKMQQLTNIKALPQSHTIYAPARNPIQPNPTPQGQSSGIAPKASRPQIRKVLAKSRKLSRKPVK